MAFELPFTFHGVDFPQAYHKVSQVYIDVDRNIAKVLLKIYKDEDTRTNDVNDYIIERSHFLARPNPTGDDLVVDNFVGQTIDLRQIIYTTLLEFPEYSSAVSV